MHSSSSRVEAAAAFLRDAASVPPDRRVADFAADLRPENVAEAYAIQDAQIGDAPVAAWKILATGTDETYSCAALAVSRVGDDGSNRPASDAHMEIEVEIAIRIGRDLPAQSAPFNEQDVADALDTAHAAFEIVETRFARRTEVPKLSALADFQSNYSVVVGSGTAGWRGLDLPDLEISLTRDGALVERARKGASVAQIISALTWLANHAVTRQSGGLKAGQFVITGARIGPSPMPGAGTLTAQVDKIGTVQMVSA